MADSRLPSPMPIRDLIALTVVALVGFVAVWEIHAHLWLCIAVTVAYGTATLLAWITARRRVSFFKRCLLVAAAYLVVGALVAAPDMYRELSQAPSLLLGVLTAPVTGWNNLLTLDLPLGVYQATLAPTVLVFTVLPYVALQFAWGSAKWWPLAAPVMLLLTVYGIAFGSSEMRPLTQMIVGLAAFLMALIWLVWRTASIRRRALRIAEASALGTANRRLPITRIATGVAVIAAATAVGMLVSPTIVSGQTRDVLRTDVDPAIIVQQRVTPLTTYRDFFTDERYDETLLRVDVEGTASSDATVTHVKLATLAAYDGEQMRVARPEQLDGAFVRVPSSIDRSDTLVETVITVEGYRDVWVPIAGDLRSINFRGEARSALADGFFYQRQTGTGVQLAARGFSPGDTIHETVEVSLAPTENIADFAPARQGPSFDAAVIPETLDTWVRAQDVSSDGAGLIELIDRLRARGLLSHALTIGETSPTWVNDLGGSYAFAPSRAGHSTDRINRLFTELLDRQEAADLNAGNAELVAATGDDEQFAVAAALIADHLGFDARVAVGFRVAEQRDPVADPGADQATAISVCETGECRGEHLTAWVEVQDAQTGTWAELVVTPQHTVTMSQELSQRSDPKNPTDADERSADPVPPLEPNPSEASDSDDEDDVVTSGLAWLIPALRITGISLLAIFIILSPAIVIVALKRLRRRTRQRLEYPSDSVAAAWEEFVDVSIDHGLPAPDTHTRSEIVAMHAREGTRADWLAEVADHADYSAEGASVDAAQSYWIVVDEERAQLRQSLKPFARLRATLSLRSLRHWFARVKQRADILEAR